MFTNRFLRWAAFSLVALLLSLDSSLLLQAEAASCMGVQILTEEEMGYYTQYRKTDYSGLLEYNGTPAAVDTKTATLYLAQTITQASQPKDLPGKLTVRSDEHLLYFAPDDHFSNLAAATQGGHPFTLLVVSGDSTYMKYNVVFTTLPVLRLDGTVTGQNAEQEELLEGNLCLWTPSDPETGRYSVQSSALQWHLRGYSSANRAKKAWKLSLRDENGLNNDLNFLGMGKDDDWILNALATDDTNLKEKMFMDLWNDWVDRNPWNYKMSTGEYVEVVRNGSYSGVYLLQRRIDRKYYRLTEHDILLKGQNTEVPTTLQNSYQIIYSPMEEEETLQLMEGIRTGSDVSMIQLDNFLDINLFLQYSAAIDNTGYKNTYYLLKWQEDSYKLYMIPWDTDMSWGVTYITDYAYNYQRSMNAQVLRREYPSMQRNFPDLKMMMSLRWEELRNSTLSEDHVLKLLEEHQTLLQESGAMNRDLACWGWFYKGKDTAENLCQFLQERLLRLDEYYTQ